MASRSGIRVSNATRPCHLSEEPWNEETGTGGLKPGQCYLIDHIHPSSPPTLPFFGFGRSHGPCNLLDDDSDKILLGLSPDKNLGFVDIEENDVDVEGRQATRDVKLGDLGGQRRALSGRKGLGVGEDTPEWHLGLIVLGEAEWK